MASRVETRIDRTSTLLPKNDTGEPASRQLPRQRATAEDPSHDRPDGERHGPRLLRDRQGRWSPILPFLGVLVRGVDAPLFGPPERHGSPVAYHPSVGYTRDIYVAIAMNWCVDLFGFSYLFHGYFAGWESRGSAWGVALGLGGVFATAFATFATSLVRKPLRSPRARWRVLRVSGTVAGLGALAVVVASALGPDSVASDVLRGLGWLSLGGASLASLFSAFGFQDGAMLATRAAVMLGVGYLVAEPLHEAMFSQEIAEAHREQQLAGIRGELAAIEPRLVDLRESAFGSCMRARSVPVDPTCGEPRAERERAELLVQAIAFVKGDEKSGKPTNATRDYLLTTARELEATAVVALLGAPGPRGEGYSPRYQQAVAMQSDAKKLAHAARSLEDSCVSAAAECEQSSAGHPEVAALGNRRSELEASLATVDQSAVDPGPIDRAIALDHLVRGSGGADGLQRASVLQGKMMAAWFLAMVMPIIVLAMKVSAGNKLEPYLRKRWAGR
jgi:hypothetical protein